MSHLKADEYEVVWHGGMKDVLLCPDANIDSSLNPKTRAVDKQSIRWMRRCQRQEQADWVDRLRIID